MNGNGESITVLTAISKDASQLLQKEKIIKTYNSLPQLSANALDAIKMFLENNVGYSGIPLACLSKIDSESVNINSAINSLSKFIPLKAGESIILELEVSADCLATIEFNLLLEIASILGKAIDTSDIQFLQDELINKLSIGIPADSVDSVSFIPMLSIKQCKFYALVNGSFGADRILFSDIKKVDLNSLDLFV